MGYVFPLLGVATFLAFLIYVIVRRVGGMTSPYRSLAKIHLGFSSVYVLGCALLAYSTRLSGERGTFPWGAALLGLYFYFALEYAFFAHIFATVIRGFSINICVAIYRLGGKATFSEIRRTYADGKGIDYVKNERIAVLLESGAIEKRGNQLHITPFGRRTALLNRWILKIWCLDYLGSSRKEEK